MKMKKIFLMIFFLIVCVNLSYAKDFFIVGETKIFYESPQGCVNTNLFGEELSNHFNLNDKINDFYVTYASDETAKQWIKDLLTGKKFSSNIRTLSIGNDKKYTNDISKIFFENSIKNQSDGFENNNLSNIEYIGKRIAKNHATWTIIGENFSVYTVSSVSYVFIKNKLITISTRASYTDKESKQEQIKWAENHSMHAIKMLLDLNS